MLNIKRKLSQNGFSLIELMIAVTILALAIFGIFHAYSVGFLGMADARDRTVATNYAREAMEDVKNMDFEKIVTTTKSVITSNIKYRVDVNVSLENENPNLKKVFTVVSWKDRNGVGKTVKTSMLVNYTEIYATAATKIVLYADSYSILNETDDPDGEGTFTKITAVIKDIKGNTVIDWDGDDVSFLIKSGPEFGNLSGITSTINGIAEETFTSSGYLLEGDVGYTVIEASVNLPIIGNVSDTVTIKITDGPVKIILSPPNPDIIKASTSNNSTIYVSLCDSENTPLLKSDLGTNVEITFEVFGEGTLSSYTITMYDTGEGLAIEEIILNSTGIPGLASVLATADDLESDTADVRFLGAPVSISISANPNPIYEDDERSTITVSLLDVNGFSTNPTEAEGNTIVELDLSTENGFLYSPLLTFEPYDFEGILETAYFDGPFSEGVVTIFANGEGLTEGSVIIEIFLALVPDHIELSANPENAKVSPGVGEEYISTIKAIVYDSSGKIVTNYKEKIYFTSLPIGTFSDGSSSIGLTPFNGVATEELSSFTPGYATVTVSSGTLDEVIVTVGFYTDPNYIGLTFNPPQKEVKADGEETITIIATIYDVNGIIITNYKEKIYFTSLPIGTFSDGSSSIGLTPFNGVATAELSSSTPGSATVTVSSGSLINEEVVEFEEEITLVLVDDSAICSPTCDIVNFSIIVTGGSIELEQMKIIWSESNPSERLYKIYLKNNEDENYEELYSGSVKSSALVDISETLSIGEYDIKLAFAQDMAERQIDVMFYPLGEGWYLIRFDVP